MDLIFNHLCTKEDGYDLNVLGVEYKKSVIAQINEYENHSNIYLKINNPNKQKEHFSYHKIDCNFETTQQAQDYFRSNLDNILLTYNIYYSTHHPLHEIKEHDQFNDDLILFQRKFNKIYHKIVDFLTPICPPQTKILEIKYQNQQHIQYKKYSITIQFYNKIHNCMDTHNIVGNNLTEIINNILINSENYK